MSSSHRLHRPSTPPHPTPPYPTPPHPTLPYPTRDEPDIALELQRALSYAICQTDRVAAKAEFRRRRTGFMKDARLSFKEVKSEGNKGKALASSMISQAIQHAKDRKALEAKEKRLLFQIRKQLSLFRVEDNNASKLQAVNAKGDDGGGMISHHSTSHHIMSYHIAHLVTSHLITVYYHISSHHCIATIPDTRDHALLTIPISPFSTSTAYPTTHTPHQTPSPPPHPQARTVKTTTPCPS